MPWHGPPNRTGLNGHDARIRTEHKIALGLTEHLVDWQIQHLRTPLKKLLPDRLASRINCTKLGAKALDWIRDLAHEPEHGRNQQGCAHTMPADHIKRLLRIETRRPECEDGDA